MKLERFIASRYSIKGNQGFTNHIVNIAIGSIAISLTIMIVTTCLINGFKHKITSKVFGFWGHIHITDSNISRNYDIKSISLEKTLIDEIDGIQYVEFQRPKQFFGKELEGQYVEDRTNGGIKSIHPFVTIPGVIQHKKNYHAVLQKGVDENYDWSHFENYIKEGRIPVITGDTISREVIISRSIAAKTILKLNDEFIISFIRDNKPIRKKMKVVGIYSTGLEEYDQKFMVCDIKLLQELLGWQSNQVQGYEVFTDYLKDIPTLTEYMYYDLLPSHIYAESIRNKYPGIFDWLELQNINEDVILKLMILVGIINMITVLLILILERSSMIGILKSLGAQNKVIRRIFILKAMKIVVWGIIFGNLLGLGICFLQYYFEFITLDEKNYYLSVAPIKFDWIRILLINVFTFFIVILCMLLPSILISKINPIKILRYE